MKQFIVMIFFCSCLFLSGTLLAQEKQEISNENGSSSGWSTTARGGGMHQFETDLDDGGNFSRSKYVVGFEETYLSGQQKSVTFAFDYSYDDYSFSSDTPGGMAALSPWEDVHSFSISIPIRMGIDRNWTALFVPSVRSTGESGAKFNETVSGGAIVGASYAFRDNLSLGPGFGIVSQLEDSTSLFPFFILRWKISDKLILETGRGPGVTLAPSLNLKYTANQQWSFVVGGGYDKLRFRLDKNGNTPGGIGEDTSIPIFASTIFNINRTIAVSLVGGLGLEGELKVEDSKGNSIITESSDPHYFAGLSLDMRF